MIGFRTKNSEYIVDSINRKITGGIFKDKWVSYLHLQAIQGEKANILLTDGRKVTTGTVKEYI